MNVRNRALVASAALALTGSAFAEQVPRGDRPIIQASKDLKNGE
jgi:hypothetical protein